MVKRTLTLAAIVGGMVVASAEAWVAPNHTMYLTFSRSVALPGVQLAAGTYTFEVVAPTVVRVSSRDGKHVYLTAFTRSVVRPQSLPADRVILFGEAPAGAAPPITAWYPQFESDGHEFIYHE